LRADLFEAGGVTIDTPEPQTEDSLLAARTIIQPDGDIICLVADETTLDDDAVAAHTTRVAAWFQEFETTTHAATATLQRSGLLLCGVLSTAGSVGVAVRTTSLLSGGAALIVLPIVLATIRHTAVRVVVGGVKSRARRRRALK
jgi:hypothetical protein